MRALRYLLFPFAWLYGLGLWIRHILYDTGILESTRPTVPTIAVGNLSLGGTGKTPHIELFLEMLHDQGPLATLSRGYGRSSKGFLKIDQAMQSSLAGDEPLQMKRKFRNVHVFVGEDRVAACNNIIAAIPDLKAILLDDALQHRKLDPSLKVLLTDFSKPYFNDHLLPMGRLRDLRSRASVADVIIVTKAPDTMSELETTVWKNQLNLRAGQTIFFSTLQYGDPYRVLKGGSIEKTSIGPNANILLVTGIANSDHLVAKVKRNAAHLEHMEFPDHHEFSHEDLSEMAARYGTFAAEPKWLMTTEKDLSRLLPQYWTSPLNYIPLIIQPVKAVVIGDKGELRSLLNEHVEKDK